MDRELFRLLDGFSHEAMRTRPADLELLGLAYIHRVYRLFRPPEPVAQVYALGDELITRDVNPYEPFIQRARCKVTLGPPPLTESQLCCPACGTDTIGESYRVEALGDATRVSLRCPTCLNEWIVERPSGPARIPLF